MRDMDNDSGQLGIRNVIAAGVAGILTSIAVYIWGVTGFDPSLWNEVTVVAGLRPPQMIFPGIWRVLIGWMFPMLGMTATLTALKVVGAVVAGVCAALVCLIVRIILSLLIRTENNYDSWSGRIAPFFSFCAAALFGMCDPLWRISRVFSPDQLRLLILLGLVYILLRWFISGGRWRLFPAMVLMGVMAAETPFAFVLPLLFIGFYTSVWRCVVDGLFPQPEKLEDPDNLPKWRMLFLLLAGIIFAAWVNTENFIALGGVSANGWKQGHVYFHYVASYWRVLAGSASVLAWVLGIGFCVLPLVVAIRIMPMVVRDDRQLPFPVGALFFFVGVVAMLQTGVLYATRFWLFAKDYVIVQSGFLLVFFVFCAIVTVALVGAGFTFECQRTYLTDEEEPVPPPGIMLRGLVPMIMLAYTVIGARQMNKPIEREMQRIVDDAVAEIVTECEDAKWIFTDGRIDAAIEIEASRRGLPLRPLNMMSGGSAWEVTLCKRGFDPETQDGKAAETGIPMLLRIWAGEKPNGMDEAAIQLGFEFWRRERKKPPEASGMVARTKWKDRAMIEKGIKASEEISKRILLISDDQDRADPTPEMANAFSAVSWRLSRFARMRKDVNLARNLDNANHALKRLMSALEYERMRTFMQLTPKEGLQLALKRADFHEASRYAAAVLKSDETDPEANFGLGMAALLGNRLKDAEHYMRLVLKRRPEEPAALNNLSIICRKLHKFKEAEELARHAIKILPNSPEVQETLNDAINKVP